MIKLSKIFSEIWYYVFLILVFGYGKRIDNLKISLDVKGEFNLKQKEGLNGLVESVCFSFFYYFIYKVKRY